MRRRPHIPVVTRKTRDQFQEDLLTWAEANLREFPWRESDRSFYEVFVAEFFLTQTPADNVAETYPRFLRRFPNLDALREASSEEVADTIEPLGFHNMRTSALTKIAAEFEEIPRDVESLQQLPRVGPYIANATVCFATNRRVPILDRNVRRVYERVFGDQFPSAVGDEADFATEMLPDDPIQARTYNLALLDFGALTCQKRTPLCETCPANSYCVYYQ